MNSKTLLSSLAVTSFFASISTTTVQAEDDGFKCYGVSAPGENACNALDHNEHDCAAASKRDHHMGDWKVVASEAECKNLKGFSEAEARKKLGLPPA